MVVVLKNGTIKQLHQKVNASVGADVADRQVLWGCLGGQSKIIAKRLACVCPQFVGKSLFVYLK